MSAEQLHRQSIVYYAWLNGNPRYDYYPHTLLRMGQTIRSWLPFSAGTWYG